MLNGSSVGETAMLKFTCRAMRPADGALQGMHPVLIDVIIVLNGVMSLIVWNFGENFMFKRVEELLFTSLQIEISISFQTKTIALYSQIVH